MADQRITQLVELSKAGIAESDVLAIVDISGSETKKVTTKNLVAAGVDLIDAGEIDLDKLDQNSTTKLGTVAIADSAITYAKIQDVSTSDRLLGRTSEGAGVVEEIICTASGRALLDDENAAAQRTTLGLGTLATQDADNASLTDVTINGGTITGITDLAIADGGTGASTASGARTNLGLVLGTDVQPYDAGLTSIAGLTTTSDQGIYLTDTDTYATFAFTNFGRTLVDDDSAETARGTLGLGALATRNTVTTTQIANGTIATVDIADGAVTIGKLGLNDRDLAGTLIANQGIDSAQLASSSVTTGKVENSAITYAKIQAVSATDRLLGRAAEGAGIVQEITCTAFGRSLIDDADASSARGTLGLGALATLDAVNGAYITDLSVNTVDLAEQSVTINKLNLNAQELAGTLIVNGGINTDQLADSAATTSKLADNAVTFAKLQNSTTTNVIIGRVSAGAGDYEEITCTQAGRNLIAETNVPNQRTRLGLGTLATQNGTFSGTHSGTTSGTNTGDQTITLTGDVTGSGTGTFATTISTGAIGTTQLASDSVTYDVIQNVSTTDVVLGRSTAGAGTIEEIACTSAGRDLIAGEDTAAQRSTLGLGTLATQNGTFSGTHSGTSSGTNTGDQTITLTGAVTGSGTGSFATTLAADTVAQGNIVSSAVTTAKINDDAVTAAKLGDHSTRTVSTDAASGSGSFTGQGWFDTSTGYAYVWDGDTWLQEAGVQNITVTESTPLSVVVTKPDNFTANLTLSLDTQVANSVFAGPTTGSDAAPTFRNLVPADLPDATATTKGIIAPGTGLSVSSGTLNHSNSVTGATVSGFTFDAQGHISAATSLGASDIPDLDASKVTTGAFATARIADDAVTADKLGDKSTALIGESLPVADFIGQMFFNPLDKNFFMWDGNVWQSIGISAGAIILAGTYDASTNEVQTVTGDGSAIGLSVGQALPSASSTNSDYYLVVAEGGTGTAPAPAVSLQPPDLILSTGSSWVEIDVSDTYTSQTASNVAFTPAANLGSTNVQSALEEVSNECRDLDNMTSGVLDVSRGGTNISSYTKGDLLAASAETTLTKLSVGTNGYILSANSNTTTGLEWIANNFGTVTSVSGTSPIQVSNGTSTPTISVNTGSTSAVGVLQLTDGVASSSTTTAATPNGVKTAYDLAALAMPKAGGTFSGQVLFNENASLVFEGSSPDNFETTLAVASPTADHTVTLPNLSGTVALTSQLDDGTFD